MLQTKHVVVSSLLILSFAACCAAAGADKKGRKARDAKVDTKITTEVNISNTGTYGALAKCDEGDYNPITSGTACYIESGETMQIKVTKKTLGLPDKTMNYEITAHNGNKSYICDDKGAIERGYAATFEELVQAVVTKSENVCTTVTAAGHNTTRAQVTVTEHTDGNVYIEFENLGEHWEPTGGYPDSTGEILVDFDQIPD